MAAFGVVGILLYKFGFEAPPLILGFVLGDSLEANFRRALILGEGDWLTFVKSPVAVVLLVLAAVMLSVTLSPRARANRAEILKDG
jgi:putative tricarboxylic transport membrane protein